MTTSDSAAEQLAMEKLVGHPDEKVKALRQRIQDETVTLFTEVEDEFLDFVWCLDAYRSRGVVPRGMGNPTKAPETRLEAIYRTKGNSFSDVLALILGNKTTSVLAARSDVQGFSQTHQIDIAWPARDTRPIVDPLVCAEVKLTGAPPSEASTAGRGAMDDWTNRRKELKFQSADLKLYRNASDTKILNWDLWRKDAPPAVYSLWGARLGEKDSHARMIREARILTATYCDGVGIYAFQAAPKADRYVPAPLSKGVDERVTSLDSVLSTIAAKIGYLVEKSGNKVPPPVRSTGPDTLF